LIELYITENIATRNSCIYIRFSFIIFKEGAGSGFVQSHLKDVSITCQIFAGKIEDAGIWISFSSRLSSVQGFLLCTFPVTCYMSKNQWCVFVCDKHYVIPQNFIWNLSSLNDSAVQQFCYMFISTGPVVWWDKNFCVLIQPFHHHLRNALLM
jgi:hypothetical protein